MKSIQTHLHSSEVIILTLELSFNSRDVILWKLEESLKSRHEGFHGIEASNDVGVEVLEETLDEINEDLWIRCRRSRHRRYLCIITITFLSIKIPDPLTINKLELALPQGLSIDRIGKRTFQIQGIIDTLLDKDVRKNGSIGEGFDMVGKTMVDNVDKLGENNLGQIDMDIVLKTMKPKGINTPNS
ncbi:hypothetical protein V6N12_060963 [Hibiscus sabdariffa]|uniref:Uncharacterized protein n=1 Tax=Hibiscus sabdariffa TaxID=183260 RepID=A0ABR2DVP3_9ROSI